MNRPEDRLQARVRMFLQTALPAPGYFSSIAHERKQSVQSGARQKARGVKAGLADVMVWYAGQFIAIELKFGRNTMSDGQAAFAVAIRANGFVAEEARCVVDVHNILARFGVPMSAAMRHYAEGHDRELGIDSDNVPRPVKRKSRMVSDGLPF